MVHLPAIRTTLRPHPEVLARLGEPRRMARDTELAAILRDGRYAASSEADSILPILALHFEVPCETSGEELDAGDQEPSFGAGDGRFIILGEAAATSEPSVGGFDDPTLALGLECSDFL